MKIEQILHSGGATKYRSHRSPELAGKRLLGKQFSNIAWQLVIDRVADRSDSKIINGPLAAHLGHGKTLHIDRQGIVPAAKLLLFLAEANHAIESEQPSAVEIRNFIQPWYPYCRVERDLTLRHIKQRGTHDEVVSPHAGIQSAGESGRNHQPRPIGVDQCLRSLGSPIAAGS